MDFSFKANLKSIIVILIIGFLGWWFLLRMLHPHDRNQLTIISEVQLQSAPSKIELSGENGWSQIFQETIEVQGKFLYFSNIQNAWFGGKLTVSDRNGKVIFNEQLEPHGRYCGNYVILLHQDGSSQTSWNHFPVPKDSTPIER